MKTKISITIIAVSMLWQNASGADYPRWRGANSDGSAGETTMPLVTQPEDVRVAWASEAFSPHPWNFFVVRGRTVWPRCVLASGGFCHPALWDGKVYVQMFRPSGTTHIAKGRHATSGEPRVTLIDADSVIVCMDAKTGRTLWEAVWEGMEINHPMQMGGHNNLCVENGMVYALGNMGLVYCADARTGEKKWAMPVGKSAEYCKVVKAYCLENKVISDDLPRTEREKYQAAESAKKKPKLPEPHKELGGSMGANMFNICPAVADGVVVTGESGGLTALVGLDAQTGEQLWSHPNSASCAAPLRWTHQGKEYIVAVGHKIAAAYEPRTGKRLWTSPNVAAGAEYNTPAIHGDYLVIAGARRNKTGERGVSEGWFCYKMSLTGVEKVWETGAKYPIGTAVSPVVHRGYVWLVASYPATAANDDPEDDTPKPKDMLVCLELATGQVVSEIPAEISAVSPGLSAMGDLLFYLSDSYIWLVNIGDPKAPKSFGRLPQPANWCSSATGADGFIYFRSAERLVVCLDVRQPTARPAESKHNDPANALFTLDLDGALQDKAAPRLFLRAKNGQFPQIWATVPPLHGYPDVVWPTTLKLTGNQLEGRVCLMSPDPYEYTIKATLKDGVITGEYEDWYTGMTVTGAVTGTVVAPPENNAVFRMIWSREWVRGAYGGVEHCLEVNLTDGKVTEVKLLPARRTQAEIVGNVESHDLNFDGELLTGKFVCTVSALPGKGGLRPGRYTVELNCPVKQNIIEGTVKSSFQDGPADTYGVSGSVEVPKTEDVKPERAVITLELPESVPFKFETGTRTKATLRIQTSEGKFISSEASVQYTAGRQQLDSSALRLDGNRIHGLVKLWCRPDGYAVRWNTYNEFTLDVTVNGNEATGTYSGIGDKREKRSGKITGTYVNED